MAGMRVQDVDGGVDGEAGSILLVQPLSTCLLRISIGLPYSR
jgi:hypothetical protein